MTTATAEAALTAYAVYGKCNHARLDDDMLIAMLQEEDTMSLFGFSLELWARADVAELFQPGQRYKVTITRAAEENDDADAD